MTLPSAFSDLISIAPLAVAQATIPGSDAAAVSWLVGAAAAAVLFKQLYEAWQIMTKGLKITPPPAETYQTLNTCKGIHTQIAELCKDKHAQEHSGHKQIMEELRTMSGAMDERFTDLRLEIKQDMNSVYSRINAIVTAQAEVNKETAAAIAEVSGTITVLTKEHHNG